MESDGGGVAIAVTPRRLSSQHSSLRDSFIASDLADALHNEFANNCAILNRNTSPGRVANLTLGAVLNCDKKSPPPDNVVVRTLLEIIRDNETLSPRTASSANNKKTWKSFKERLKLKRNQSQSQNPNSHRWASSLPVPQSDIMPRSRSSLAEEMNMTTLRSSSLRQVENVPADDMALREVNSGSFRLSAVLAAEREETHRRLSREFDEDNNRNRDDDDGGGDGDGSEGSPRVVGDDNEEDEGGIPESGLSSGQPMRMSLMDLLEETDRQAGISGPTYRLDDEEVEEEEEAAEEEEEVVDNRKGEFSCCVCMVRHKGAAFIPCGHTFCRLCSRELFVQRGNCPLCNNFIVEILDIF